MEGTIKGGEHNMRGHLEGDSMILGTVVAVHHA